MGGKKNVVFGLFYLVLTALLGPYMATTYFGPLQEAEQAHAAAVTELNRAVEAGAEGQIVQAQTDAILSFNRQQTAAEPIDNIKSGPHAHGNLEALLNIVVGVLIGFLAVASWWKETISWLFIGGALLHSGMLYLGTVLGQGWAWGVLGTGIGPMMILAGLLVAGAASVKGFEARPAR
ncbi:MAG TPA: hypothetical protein VFN94_09595 [Nitrospiria bacterium]|nr:hypothetical protein [Nitrospiria bacterium]